MRILYPLLNCSIWACLVVTLAFSSNCSAQWHDTTGFESGWGIWNDGGSDAYRLKDDDRNLPGDYCARIRDNSGKESSIFTKLLDFRNYSKVNLSFKYGSESMESGEEFYLEHSDDGGDHYEKIRTYRRGSHFENGDYKNESVDISKNFTSKTVFRFRCNASSNYDMIYLDDIKISASGGTTVSNCSTKKIRVKNSGDCSVRLYRWESSGDVFIDKISEGDHKDVSLAEGKMLRVIDSGGDFHDLDFDKSYTVGSDCDQTFTVNPTYCNSGSGCSGAITGFSIDSHSSGLVGNISGAEYCKDKFKSSDISIRAHVSGSHQSLKYTIQTPQGTWTNTENHETYDSNKFWATAPGTYTVTAKLYSKDDLDGTQCDIKTISFKIKDCTPIPPACTYKSIAVKNNGSCAVYLYRWQASGDVYLGYISAGGTKTVSLAEHKMLRVIDTGRNWSNLAFDKSYTVGSDCHQSFHVSPTYCVPTYDCPSLGKNIGDACNDGNHNTHTDVVTAHCVCAGTPIVPVCNYKKVNVKNTGSCGVKLYRWETSGDVFIANISAGGSREVSLLEGKKLRAIDNGGDFHNLVFDKSYMVGSACTQTFSMSTDYCDQPTPGGPCTYGPVHYQGFENSWGSWIDGGSDCYRSYEPNSSAIGNYCVRLRDNSGSSSSMYTKHFDLRNVSECQVEFMYISESMERDEDFYFEYSTDGGRSYKQAGRWISGQHFQNKVKKSEKVSFTGNFSSSTVFRFRCDASSNYDMVYFDEITISACGPSGTLRVISDTNKEVAGFDGDQPADEFTFAAPELDNEEPMGSEISVYPNPVSEVLTLEGLHEGVTYDVISVTGRKVIENETTNRLDLSNLDNGTYLLRSVDGQVLRFVKI